MSGCFPSASVHPESHSGDPVTADNTDTIATDDLSASPEPMTARARAERILSLVADHGEKIIDLASDPLDIPDYVLLTLVQAGEALVRLAELDADRDRSAASEPDLIVDVLGGKWFAEHDNEGNYAAEEDPAKVFTASYIRRSWGPTREYVLRPPRPAS